MSRFHTCSPETRSCVRNANVPPFARETPRTLRSTYSERVMLAVQVFMSSDEILNLLRDFILPKKPKSYICRQ